MGMIPVGPRLTNGKTVREGLARLDAGEAVETRCAVHKSGQKQPVPVDRTILGHGIRDMDDGVITLGEFQDRAGDGAIHRDFIDWPPGDRHRLFSNSQVIFARGGLRHDGEQ